MNTTVFWLLLGLMIVAYASLECWLYWRRKRKHGQSLAEFSARLEEPSVVPLAPACLARLRLLAEQQRQQEWSRQGRVIVLEVERLALPPGRNEQYN